MRASIEERFWAKVDKDGPDPHDDPARGALLGNCWIWTAARSLGYGRFHLVSGKPPIAAYVYAWESVNGPRPAGLYLDHFACDRRECVRPGHLRPVTPRENALRSDSIAARSLAKTHCPHGHKYTDALIKRGKTYVRVCQVCERAHQVRSNRKSREARAAARGEDIVATDKLMAELNALARARRMELRPQWQPRG